MDSQVGVRIAIQNSRFLEFLILLYGKMSTVSFSFPHNPRQTRVASMEQKNYLPESPRYSGGFFFISALRKLVAATAIMCYTVVYPSRAAGAAFWARVRNTNLYLLQKDVN